jgi:hypothetical protein
MNGETMSQITLDTRQHKNGGARRDECKLAADLKNWVADLDGAEALRREQLRQIAKLRSDVYQLAKARGVTPNTLRAARRLMRK